MTKLLIDLATTLNIIGNTLWKSFKASKVRCTREKSTKELYDY